MRGLRPQKPLVKRGSLDFPIVLNNMLECGTFGLLTVLQPYTALAFTPQHRTTADNIMQKYIINHNNIMSVNRATDYDDRGGGGS